MKIVSELKLKTDKSIEKENSFSKPKIEMKNFSRKSGVLCDLF